MLKMKTVCCRIVLKQLLFEGRGLNPASCYMNMKRLGGGAGTSLPVFVMRTSPGRINCNSTQALVSCKMLYATT
jgi:hypothetical protein